MKKLDMNHIIKPNILDLAPYSSAREEYTGSEGIFLDANENTHALPFNRYPDPYQRELKSKLADWRGVPIERIFLGNGSDEVIDLLIRATCQEGKDRILSLDPSYGMYKVSAAVNNVPIDLVSMNADMSIDEDNLFSMLSDAHKLIFICSPNNPNGGTIKSNLIERLLNNSNNLIIVDEAYIDFSKTTSWVNRLREYDNLIVLQTFSKSLGAAGLRVGMGYMHPSLVGILNKIKPPYNISAPAQEWAIRRLDQKEQINTYINKIVEERARMRAVLSSLNYVDYIFPSEANFLLIRFQNCDAVFRYLIDHKVIVRDRSNNRHCSNSLRISIGTESENHKLISLLRNFES